MTGSQLDKTWLGDQFQKYPLKGDDGALWFIMHLLRASDMPESEHVPYLAQFGAHAKDKVLNPHDAAPPAQTQAWLGDVLRQALGMAPNGADLLWLLEHLRSQTDTPAEPRASYAFGETHAIKRGHEDFETVEKIAREHGFEVTDVSRIYERHPTGIRFHALPLGPIPYAKQQALLDALAEAGLKYWEA
jgi:hypothetical protein